MREIKFRGKCRVADKWFYGDLVTDRGLSAIVTDARIYDEGGTPWVKRIYEVDTETVGQYTNLKTKKGREIYEGDVALYEDGEVTFVAVIEFAEYEICFRVIKPFEDIYDFDEFYEDGELDVKIIGNIYEQPELLEVVVGDIGGSWGCCVME